MSWGRSWAKPRLLPLTIGVVGLVFVVKLVTLAQGPGVPSVIAGAGRAMVPSARAAAKELPAAPPAEKSAATAKLGTAAVCAPKPEMDTAPPAEPMPSEAERALLVDLRARRKVLDERAETLESRGAVLAATEHHLSERLDQLGALQTKLEQLEQTRRERDEGNWRSMVKTYETMRPRDAAAIFNDLDSAVLLQVLDRMKETKAAAVLAAMQPERARVATTELAKWRTRVPEVPQP